MADDDPKAFIATRQRLANAFAQAAIKILAKYFPDCDVTVQMRRGEINRVDIRVIEAVTVT